MNKFHEKIIEKDRCFVIAEAGVNHNGNMDLACQLVEVAAQANVDAIKFQTFSADKLVIPNAPKAQYQIDNASQPESQLEMLRKLELSKEDHYILKKLCDEKNIMFLSTPFDEDWVDFLDELEVPAFKIGSGDLTNLPLLCHVARKNKPMILSTGMSHLEEVERAVKTIFEINRVPLTILHCVSCYPAEPFEINLRVMSTLINHFNLPVGYSDHSQGISIALAAVAMGATVLEKHFTLNKHLEGPDHKASLEPHELELMMKEIRSIELALGNGQKVPCQRELEVAMVARRSLVSTKDLNPGDILTMEAIAVKRPGSGLSPSKISDLLDREIKKPVRKGELFTLDVFQ